MTRPIDFVKVRREMPARTHTLTLSATPRPPRLLLPLHGNGPPAAVAIAAAGHKPALAEARLDHFACMRCKFYTTFQHILELARPELMVSSRNNRNVYSRDIRQQHGPATLQTLFQSDR